jgi:hypothetical protein
MEGGAARGGGRRGLAAAAGGRRLGRPSLRSRWEEEEGARAEELSSGHSTEAAWTAVLCRGACRGERHLREAALDPGWSP